MLEEEEGNGNRVEISNIKKANLMLFKILNELADCLKINIQLICYLIEKFIFHLKEILKAFILQKAAFA